MAVSVRRLFWGTMVTIALSGLAVQAGAVSYVDPDPLNPNVTILYQGSVLLDPVPGISLGDVYIDYWAFTHAGDPGYFYSYRIRNVSGSSITGAPAAITYLGLTDVSPFTNLGNGGGKGGGVNFIPWFFIGDEAAGDAEWAGSVTSAIRVGSASPDVADAAKMFQIHSLYEPDAGILWVATASGGGYSGQNVGVYVPGLIPEPATLASIGFGLVGLRLLRGRRSR